MSVRITAAERDALYEQIYVRLSGIDEVWMAAEAGGLRSGPTGWRASSRDDLRLILDDLGWGEGSGEPLELTTPARCPAARLHSDAKPSRRATQERGSRRAGPSGRPERSARSGPSRPAGGCLENWAKSASRSYGRTDVD